MMQHNNSNNKQPRPDIQVRPAGQKDIPGLWILYQGFIQAEEHFAGGELYPNPRAVRYEQFLGEMLEMTQSPLWALFVALDSEKPVGYICAAVCERENGAPDHYLFVRDIYVSPEYRARFSIAKKLRHNLDAWLRGWNAAAESSDIPELKYVEIAASAVESQVRRWTRKGFKPYAVLLRKEI